MPRVSLVPVARAAPLGLPLTDRKSSTVTLGSVLPMTCGCATLVIFRPPDESSEGRRPMVGWAGGLGSPRLFAWSLKVKVARFPVVPELSVAWIPIVLMPLLVNEAWLTLIEKRPKASVLLAVMLVAGLFGS